MEHSTHTNYGFKKYQQLVLIRLLQTRSVWKAKFVSENSFFQRIFMFYLFHCQTTFKDEIKTQGGIFLLFFRSNLNGNRQKNCSSFVHKIEPNVFFFSSWQQSGEKTKFDLLQNKNKLLFSVIYLAQGFLCWWKMLCTFCFFKRNKQDSQIHQNWSRPRLHELMKKKRMLYLLINELFF